MFLDEVALLLQRLLGVVQPPRVGRAAGVGSGSAAVALEDLVVAHGRPGQCELRGVAGAADAVLHLAEVALQLLHQLGTLLSVHLRQALTQNPSTSPARTVRAPTGPPPNRPATPPGGGSRIKFLAPIEVPELGEFLEKELPKAGLSIGGGEAEADELESKFSGQGLDGQVVAREVSGCPGVLSVQVVVRAT